MELLLLIDAVLNIRSADTNGVGFGANMNAYAAIEELSRNSADKSVLYQQILKDHIAPAYDELICTLFRNTGAFSTTFDDADYKFKYLVQNNLEDGLVYNIREDRWTDNVKSSIMSDIIILEAVSKILGLMITCNQFLVPSPIHNIYVD